MTPEHVERGMSAAEEAPFVDDGVGGPPDALVLDIGDGVGALVLYAEESCLGREIAITRAGSPHSHDTHTMIRRRRALDRAVVAGVYPELEAGAYDVWGVHGEIVGQVVIVGGKVTEYDAGRCGEPCV